MVDTARKPASSRRFADPPANTGEFIQEWVNAAVDHVWVYARAEPEKAILWALGIGFALGWKLKS